MERNSRLRRAAVVPAVVLGLAAAATATAAVTGGDAPKDQVGTVESAPAQRLLAPPPSATPAAAKASFGVLRRAAVKADAPGASLADRFEAVGANPGLARLAINSATPSSRYFIVPGRNGTICMLDGTASGGCLPAEIAAQRGTIGANECPVGAGEDAIELYGSVPDGVARVTLAYADGRTRSVAVTSNAWSVQVARGDRPVTVAWSSGATESESAVPYSPDVELPC